MGLFGDSKAKCAQCGAALPAAVKASDDRIDDLMRASAVNRIKRPVNAVCIACRQKAAATDVLTVPIVPASSKAAGPRPPATAVYSSDPVIADPQRQQEVSDKQNRDPADELRALFTIPANIMQTEAGRYAVIGISGALFLLIVLIVIARNFDTAVDTRDEKTVEAPTVPQPASTPKPIAVTPYKPRPSNYPGRWVTTNDYPARALMQERQGTTAFRLEVSAQGKITGCTVTQSSGSDDLDTATCNAVIKRAKFKPALDYDGKPVASMYSSRVRWQIPVE